jgi:lactate dehydrogenase-like 2-hydroxyacid dehydrogenase
VDEQAPALALKTGVIGGAGFDVSSEPPKNGNVLLGIRSAKFHCDTAYRVG